MGSVTLNIVIHAPVMLNILDAQKRLRFQKKTGEIHDIILNTQKVKVDEISDFRYMTCGFVQGRRIQDKYVAPPTTIQPFLCTIFRAMSHVDFRVANSRSI